MLSFMLNAYTEFEVHRPSRCHCVYPSGDLSALELVCNVIFGTDILPAILMLVQLFFVKLWANMHQTDDVTLQPWLLIFEVITHNGDAGWWCGSPYSISTPSLQFIDSLVPKKWLMFHHGIYSSGDLNLWPFDLWMGSQVTYVMGSLPSNYLCDGRVA